MKIRTNYVSNSSSSSFCVVGYKICSTSYMHDIVFDSEKYNYIMLGKYLNEGIDFVLLDDEMIKYLQNDSLEDDYDVIQVLSYSFGDDYYNEMKQVPDIIMKSQVFFGTKDDDSTTNINQFKQRYSILPF